MDSLSAQKTVYAFVYDPWNPDTMYVALREGIFTSHDRGKSWTLLDKSPKGVVTMVIHPKNTAKMFAGTSEGSIFRSLDTGETWTLQSK